MNSFFGSALVVGVALCAQPTFAQSINDDGAKALSGTLSTYIGKAAIDQKIVTVEPQADAYRITFDAGRLAALYGVSAERFQMAPMYMLTAPKADGTWAVKADAMPPYSIIMPTFNGDMRQEMRSTGYKFDGVFDPKLVSFISSSTSIDFVAITSKSPEQDDDMQMHGISVDLKGSAGAVGLDAKVTEAIKGMTDSASITIPGVKGAPPTTMAVNFDIGTINVDANVEALRTREVMDLWAFFVANAGKDQVTAAQDDLKAKLKAALPLWGQMASNSTMQDVAFRIPQGIFGVRSYTDKLRFSGVAKDASAAIGFKLEGFTVPSALLPSWADGLTPTMIDLNFAFGGVDLDQIARLAIDEFDLKADPPLPLTMRDRIIGIIMQGQPKVTLAKSQLIASDYDLSFEGEMQIQTPVPTGRLTISARDFDKTFDALQQVASHEPKAQQIMAALIFAKGLAKPGPDGQSVWDMEYGADRVPVVNGQRLGGPKK